VGGVVATVVRVGDRHVLRHLRNVLVREAGRRHDLVRFYEVDTLVSSEVVDAFFDSGLIRPNAEASVHMHEWAFRLANHPLFFRFMCDRLTDISHLIAAASARVQC
jgi:hypothetical protein